MKKLFIVSLTICLLLSMVGCNKEPDPIVPEHIEASHLIRVAYENVYKKDIVHINTARTYSEFYSYSGYDPNEETSQNTSEDVMLCLDNRAIEIWRNNMTSEHIRTRIDRNNEGVYSKGVAYQLKQDCIFENESYSYKSYVQSWHKQHGELVDLGPECSAGYNDVFYWNWANLVAFEEVFSVIETEDNSQYVLVSKPILWEDLFYSKSPVVITVSINRENLTFKTIKLQCDNWTETAEFDFFTNEQKDVFYDKIPAEAWDSMPTDRKLFTSPADMPLDDGYVSFMYPYEYVKEVLKEDDVSGSWTVVD